MKKVAIYGLTHTILSKQEMDTLLIILEKYKIIIFFEKQFYNLLKAQKVLCKKYSTFSSFEDLNNSFQAFFSIGGDGTILQAATYVRNLEIPILGINAGRLGFLANIQKNNIQKTIELLLKKEYYIQQRSLVTIKTIPEIEDFSEIPFALNEITIARGNTASMIGIKTHLNNEYLTSYWADGLIIATPTGSTGYSLSCNGSLILPNSKNLIITPIAPHNLNARPIVIPDETSIELEVDGRESHFLISLDSRIATVPKHTKVFIKKASFSIKSIMLKNQSFLNTLRNKLLWGKDIRNE